MKTFLRARALTIWTALIAFGPLSAQQLVAEPPLHNHGVISEDGKMYVGVDYYPEHWTEDRWETDFRLMQEAGFNIVRMSEFAWANMEPAEGQFEFDWLDRVLDLADAHKIKVILGTPTAVMPAWLARKYPEALAMKGDGTRIVWGGRRNNCFSDLAYRRLSERIVGEMVHHYANHPAVVGWQIDNELGGTDCRCDKCRRNFQEWLRRKYGTLENLNRAWGNHFWGLQISQWDEVPIPDDREGEWAVSNPSASLDWMRFTSQLNVDFLKAQTDIIRAVCPPSHFVTHNLMGLYSKVDYYDLTKPLDFVSWDNYPTLSPNIPYDSALAADVMRGLKKQNFLIMEQTAGPLGWGVFGRNPQPGELRKICYQQLAHGADGQLWFRWRTCTAGREQYWHGLLGHDGEPGRRYREAAQVAKEYQKLAPYLAGTTPHNAVAILYDYDSIWALQIQNGYPNASHKQAIKRYYRALWRAGVGVDIVKPGDDLTGYRLVLASHLNVLPDDVANSLVEYVKQGGVLLVDCRTGIKDEHNLVYARTLPGLLSEVLGIRIDEYESLRLGITDEQETTYGLQANELADRVFTATKYADWIVPTSAQSIGKYDQPHLRKYAAVTRHSHGKGVGWYVGTIVAEEEFYDALMVRLLDDANIKPIVHPPRGVEIATRSGDNHQLLFLVNHTDEKQSVEVLSGRRELLTGTKTSDSLVLEGFGVAVIER